MCRHLAFLGRPRTLASLVLLVVCLIAALLMIFKTDFFDRSEHLSR